MAAHAVPSYFFILLETGFVQGARPALKLQILTSISVRLAVLKPSDCLVRGGLAWRLTATSIGSSLRFCMWLIQSLKVNGLVFLQNSSDSSSCPFPLWDRAPLLFRCCNMGTQIWCVYDSSRASLLLLPPVANCREYNFPVLGDRRTLEGRLASACGALLTSRLVHGAESHRSANAGCVYDSGSAIRLS